MTLSDFNLHLPKYLTEKSSEQLKAALGSYPDLSFDTFYSSDFEENILYQGDGIKNLIVIDLPNTEVKKTNCIIISNTCDIDIQNRRFTPSRVLYAPIVPLEKYAEKLTQFVPKQIEAHLNSIRRQEPTQLFYLPEYPNIMKESIVFLDRILNLSNSHFNRDFLKSERLFFLSQFGHYLFLTKLSIHLSRVQEGVERGFLAK